MIAAELDFGWPEIAFNSEALVIAHRAFSREDLICVTGSFYLVGEAKRLFAPAPDDAAA